MPEPAPIRGAMRAFVEAGPEGVDRAIAGMQEPFGLGGEPLTLEREEVGSFNPPRHADLHRELAGGDELAAAFVNRLLDWEIAGTVRVEGKRAWFSAEEWPLDRRQALLGAALAAPRRLHTHPELDRFLTATAASCFRAGVKPNRVDWFCTVVLQKLGPHGLLGMDRLALMLRHRLCRITALPVLAKGGPGLRKLRGVLFEEMDAEPRWCGPDLAQAVADAVADSPEGVAELWRRRPGPGKTHGVLDVLERLGPRLAGREREVLAWLRERVDEPGEARWPPLHAYGSVGRDRPEVIEKLLTFCPEGGADVPAADVEAGASEGVWIRHGLYAAAMEALAFSTTSAGTVVPVLRRGLRRYVELDPDMTYEGDHERVATALARFGPAAAPALPDVAEILREHRRERTERPRAVCRLVIAMGAAASSLLPELDRWALEDEEAEEDLIEYLDPEIWWTRMARSIRAARDAAP